MRRPILAGNWKMNGSRESVPPLLKAIKKGADSLNNIELIVFPPYVFLEETARELAGSPIAWGAQNFNPHHNGAFTGEISAAMLLDFHCRYVLVGHSERRTLYGETDSVVATKYNAALNAGLYPIVCVGETLDERQAGITQQVISCQLGAIFASVAGVEGLQQAVVAYEPVWAIGTGLTADPNIAQEVHAQIREMVASYDKNIASELRILYGGSVKRENAANLFAMPDIDGGLIGGASLNEQEFLDIARHLSDTGTH